MAGLLVLCFALNVHHGTPGWAGRFGAISVVVTLALYGVLQAEERTGTCLHMDARIC